MEKKDIMLEIPLRTIENQSIENLDIKIYGSLEELGVVLIDKQFLEDGKIISELYGASNGAIRFNKSVQENGMYFNFGKKHGYIDDCSRILLLIGFDGYFSDSFTEVQKKIGHHLRENYYNLNEMKE